MNCGLSVVGNGLGPYNSLVASEIASKPKDMRSLMGTIRFPFTLIKKENKNKNENKKITIITYVHGALNKAPKCFSTRGALSIA